MANLGTQFECNPIGALADAQATIARLTTEIEAALKEQDRLAKAWEAKHVYQVAQSKGHAEYFDKSQRRMHELVAERDQARAETAAAYERVVQWLIDAGIAGDGEGDTLATCIRALEPDTTALAEMLDAETRACAEICDRQAETFSTEEYAVGQPLSSFSERFACRVIKKAILARLDQRKEAGA